MLSLYVTSGLCQEKVNERVEMRSVGEFSSQAVVMQVRGWKDVFNPWKNPEDRDSMYAINGFNGAGIDILVLAQIQEFGTDSSSDTSPLTSSC